MQDAVRTRREHAIEMIIFSIICSLLVLTKFLGLFYVTQIFGGFVNFFPLHWINLGSLLVTRAETWKCASHDSEDWKQVKITLDLFLFQTELFSQPHRVYLETQEGFGFFSPHPWIYEQATTVPTLEIYAVITLYVSFWKWPSCHPHRTISCDNTLFWVQSHLTDPFCKLPWKSQQKVYHNLSLKHSTKFQDP